MTAGEAERIREALLALATERGTGKTFCPSEAARRVSEKDWRGLMPAVRETAEDLRSEGRLRVCQRGVEQPSAHVPGPIRLGLPPNREQA